MKRYTTEQKAALISSWQHSTFSKAEFCKRRNISYTTFYKWLKELEEDAPEEVVATPSPAMQFVEVEQPKKLASASRQDRRKLIITTADGIRLELEL